MMACLRLLLLCAALLCAGAAHAGPEPTLRFDHLSVQDGLPQESVLSIAQDREGFMWFGTQSGVSRFDGYRFTSYRNETGKPNSLANNWVRVLHIDRHGQLWLATDGGLNRFDPVTRSFTLYLPDQPARRGNGNRHIKALISDGGDGLWLGTGDGLQHFDMVSKRFTSRPRRARTATTPSTRWRWTPADACGSAPRRAWTASARSASASSTTARG